MSSSMLRGLAGTLACALTFATLGSVSYADEPTPLATEPAPAPKRYAPFVLLTDGLSLGTYTAGIAMNQAGVAGFGLLGSLFASPIVHAAHGRGWTALLSMGLRLGGFAAGAFAGALAQESFDDRPCPSSGTAGCFGRTLAWASVGGGLALLPVSLVDALVLAHEDVPPSARAATRPTFSDGLRVNLGVSNSSVSLGLSGAL